MTVAQPLETQPTAVPGLPGWWPAVRRAGSVLLILLVLVGAWEGYKALGAATGGLIPFTALPLPVRADDKSMPHVWTIVGVLFQPARRGAEQLLWQILLEAALFTWREALAGFVVGSLVGFLLGVVFVHSPLLERGLMPYVVASQTVPLLAIAPMVVIWGSRLGWPAWASVTIISAYLTFFPVAINTLRGLNSPEPTALELMRSYAATRRQILWKLRLPAALPYLFTALKISASVSVIGAIVGELPSGIPDGLGRALLTFSYYYITGPEKLYAAILFSALLGLTFVVLVMLVERLVLPAQRRLE
ncbi:MAG: ABC transporter permease [Anaerolineales bacterium]|nr:ABC transporter permease [Anaerolineales bacterium]